MMFHLFSMSHKQRNMLKIEMKETLSLSFTIAINGHFHFFVFYVLLPNEYIFLCGYNCNVDMVPYFVFHLTFDHRHFSVSLL